MCRTSRKLFLCKKIVFNKIHCTCAYHSLFVPETKASCGVKTDSLSLNGVRVQKSIDKKMNRKVYIIYLYSKPTFTN